MVIDGVLRQCANSVGSVAFTVEQVGSLTEARQRAVEEAHRPFLLESGPLLRTHVLRVEEDAWMLVLVMHHIVSDGWSMGVLLREVSQLYGAWEAGVRTNPLPPLPVQYGDFAVWQRGWMEGEALEAQVSYWRERLTGAPEVVELPVDRPRPAVRTTRGGAVGFEIPVEVVQSLRGVAKETDATLYMVLLAAYAGWLGRQGAGQDVVVRFGWA